MRSSAFRRLAASYVSAFRTTPARCLSTRALDSSLKSSTIDCFVWGKGSDGVLGLGDRKDQRDPEIVEFENHDLSIVSFAAGPSHSAAVDSDGKLWTFGKNEYGKLGAKIDKSTTHVIEPVRVVVGNDQERVVAVDCGEYHTVALTGKMFHHCCCLHCVLCLNVVSELIHDRKWCRVFMGMGWTLVERKWCSWTWVQGICIYT